MALQLNYSPPIRLYPDGIKGREASELSSVLYRMDSSTAVQNEVVAFSRLWPGGHR